MKKRKVTRQASNLAENYSIANGKHFRLKDYSPGDTGPFASKDDALPLFEETVGMLGNMREKLYAQDRWGLLLIFQGMDAAGKDGAIKHVMSGINPQGCDVYSFKTPSAEELDHDYMWRTHARTPSRGKIGIFNRSHYEEVLVVRVHPPILESQKLPKSLVTKRTWDERYDDINSFERYLSRNGILVRKFFLHVSRNEQKKRFLERLDDSKKNWKFSMADVKERAFWDDYQCAYQEAIWQTSTEHAPWCVVPADNKWFARLVIACTIIDTLQGLNLAFPDVDKEKKKELAAVRESLLHERK